MARPRPLARPPRSLRVRPGAGYRPRSTETVGSLLHPAQGTFSTSGFSAVGGAARRPCRAPRRRLSTARLAIARRVGTRGAADVRREHHVGHVEQRRDARSARLRTRRGPAAAMRLLAQCIGQRGIVHHAAARDVRQGRGRLHLRELGRTDEVMRRGDVRHHDDEVSAARSSSSFGDVARTELRLDPRASSRDAVVVEHRACRSRVRRGVPPPGRCGPCRGCPASRGACRCRGTCRRPSASTRRGAGTARSRRCGAPRPSSARSRGPPWSRRARRARWSRARRARCTPARRCCCSRPPCCTPRAGADTRRAAGVDALGTGHEHAGLAVQPRAQLVGRPQDVGIVRLDVERVAQPRDDVVEQAAVTSTAGFIDRTF